MALFFDSEHADNRYVMNAEQMRAHDQQAIHEHKIPGSILMDNAGRRCAEIICDRFATKKKVAILCGGGNNGGDGFVIARYLNRKGFAVEVFTSHAPSSLHGDAAQAFACLAPLEITTKSSEQFSPNSFNLIVDALLGTGFHGILSTPIQQLIDVVNHADTTVVAVDIPSGLKAASAQALPSIHATLTITFACAKPALLLYPAALAAGDIYVVDIGFAKPANSSVRIADIATLRHVSSTLNRRPKHAHKGNFGHILVVGGSHGMMGAPILTAEAALRSGAGLVTLVVPGGNTPPPHMPEIMRRCIGAGPHLTIDDADAIKALIKQLRVDGLVMGMGMGRAPKTLQLVNELLTQVDLPCVVDADGLYGLQNLSQPLNRQHPWVATPHPKEFEQAFATPAITEQRDALACLNQLSQHYHMNLVYKGAHSISTTTDGNQWINSSGNLGMATAGMGDALAGIIGTFITQKIPNATALAVFIHGIAGDIAAKQRGQGLVTSDVIACLPLALQHFMEQ